MTLKLIVGMEMELGQFQGSMNECGIRGQGEGHSNMYTFHLHTSAFNLHYICLQMLYIEFQMICLSDMLITIIYFDFVNMGTVESQVPIIMDCDSDPTFHHFPIYIYLYDIYNI